MTELFRGKPVKEVKKGICLECNPTKNQYIVYYVDGTKEEVWKSGKWNSKMGAARGIEYDPEHLFLMDYSKRKQDKMEIE